MIDFRKSTAEDELAAAVMHNMERKAAAEHEYVPQSEASREAVLDEELAHDLAMEVGSPVIVLSRENINRHNVDRFIEELEVAV